MNNSIIERCESLLERMEALEERGTKGEWLLDGALVYALQHHGWKRGAETFQNRFHASVQPGSNCSTEEASANASLIAFAHASLIAFAHNHSKTERVMVWGLLELLNYGVHMTDGTTLTRGYKSALEDSLTRWADSTEAELGKVGA